MTNIRKLSLTGPLSSFNEVRTVGRDTQIELKSSVNQISQLRNIVTEAGSATASIAAGEYQLSTTALASDKVTLDSAERGRYHPGFSCEIGVGYRQAASTAFSGEMEDRWGYFDDDNGFGFGEDATGVFIFTRRAGVDTKVYQASWNRDTVDGTGASQLTLDTEAGNIYQIEFAWYGYGAIAFQVIMARADGAQQAILVHVVDPTGENSVQQPNLPIRVEVGNGATATAHTAYVGGRQFSIIGQSSPTWRVTTEQRLSVTGIGTAAWVPLISVRRKAGTFLAESIRLHRVDILADGDLIVGLFNNATLTSPTWGTPTDTDANETVLESDTAASFSGGLLVNKFLAAGGTNKDRGLNLPDVEREFDLIEQQPLTLAVKAVSGSNITASAILAMREEW